MSAARWRRLGSEAEADDRRAGNTGPISDEALWECLADHFSAELSEFSEDDREAAVDELLIGYREGA